MSTIKTCLPEFYWILAFPGLKIFTANTIYFTSLQSTGTQDAIIDDFRGR